MTSPGNEALEDLLNSSGSLSADEAAAAGEMGGGPAMMESSAAEENAAVGVPVHQPVVCARCGQQVCDRFFLMAAGRVWHGSCLRCSLCQCELQTHSSLFWRDGNIYCQQDYHRLFGGGQCARCFQPIPPSALVMKSGELTFHLHCFSCQECDVKLMPGNLYSMQGPNLYCQQHYLDEGARAGQSECVLPTSFTEAIETGQNHVSGEDSVSSPEPRVDDKAAGGRSRRRTKRIRTCFRREQLRALETYFAQKHNPDGKDWTCLAHKTGLPKRVLQVWFQNARAKLRRSLNSEYPPLSSPSAAIPSVPAPTGFSPLSDQTPFPTSTIDQLQLSLLTAPIGEQSASPLAFQSSQQLLQSADLFLDCGSAHTGSTLQLQERYGDGSPEAGREGSSDMFRLHFG